MKTLFFDTETSGVHSTARITQLAWQLYDDLTIVDEFSSLITPDGWEVPKEDFFIRNNMSTERCQAEGIDIHGALVSFEACANASDVLVAHNFDFDWRVLSYEFKLMGTMPLFTAGKICTMKLTTDFCKLPNTRGYNSYKWPKLEELHAVLFGESFDGAHDALSDVRACAKCFFELKHRGIISI